MVMILTMMRKLLDGAGPTLPNVESYRRFLLSME